MSKSFCALVLNLLLVSCKSLAPHVRDSQLSQISPPESISLGKGYDTDTVQSLDHCTTGEEHVEKQAQASWFYQAVESWGPVKRDLGFASDAVYAYELARESPRAQFTREIHDTELSSSYLLRADYIVATKFYRDMQISPLYWKLAMGSPDEKLEFRRRCGNHYTSQVDIGGKLRVLIKFHFNNKLAKSGFEFQVKMPENSTIPALKPAGLSDKDRQNSTVRVMFYQEGGDESRFRADIPIANGVECKLDAWDKCQKLIEQFFHYSLSVFPADIHNSQTSAVAFATRPYDELDVPPFSESSVLNRLSSIRELELQDFDRMKVEHILSHVENYLTQDRLQKLENAKNVLSRNLKVLKDNIIQCMEFRVGEPHCLEPAQLNLESYDPKLLFAGSEAVQGPFLGGDSGSPYGRICGNLMYGAKGYSGKVLDQLIVICDDGSTLSPLSNSHGRENYQQTCPLGHVVTGMRGNRSGDGVVNSLFFVCSDLNSLRDGRGPGWQTEIRVMGKDRNFTWDCPNGFAAAGVAGRSAKYVDSIALVCVNY